GPPIGARHRVFIGRQSISRRKLRRREDVLHSYERAAQRARSAAGNLSGRTLRIVTNECTNFTLMRGEPRELTLCQRLSRVEAGNAAEIFSRVSHSDPSP